MSPRQPMPLVSAARKQPDRSLSKLAACCALASCLLSVAHAAAQQSVMIDGVRPELHAGIGWGAELGFGARADIPIVPNGFLVEPVDEFAISPGGDLYLDLDHDGRVSFDLVLPAQWNLYLDPKWSVFPELGFALTLRRGHAHPDLYVGGGGRYHFSRRNALVLRLSWPFGVQVGLTL